MPPPRAEGDSPELHLEVLIGTLQRHNVEYLIMLPGELALLGEGSVKPNKLSDPQFGRWGASSPPRGMSPGVLL